MTKMMSREELSKRFVEVASEFAVALAARLCDGVERGEAPDVDRVLRGEVLELGDALLAETAAASGPASLRSLVSLSSP